MLNSSFLSLLFGKSTHRIPCGKNDRLCLEHFEDLLRADGLVYDHLVDELPEPVVGHDQVALFIPILTPRILHTPFQRLVALLKIENIVAIKTI